MKHIQYPKLLLLLCSFILAYILYHLGTFAMLPTALHGHGYISMFLGGLLFSFGFTTPFGIAIFVAMSNFVNPVLGGIVAGAGALLSDMAIFQFVRFSFEDELHQLKKHKIFLWLRQAVHHERLPETVRNYLLWSIAGLIIVSPLPDELGITMLGAFSNIRSKPFMLVCYALNTCGVIVILLSAQTLFA